MLLQCVEQCIVVRVIIRGREKKIKQEHRAHIDEACYTHQVPKAESEKEHACLVGINMEQHHV